MPTVVSMRAQPRSWSLRATCQACADIVPSYQAHRIEKAIYCTPCAREVMRWDLAEMSRALAS